MNKLICILFFFFCFLPNAYSAAFIILKDSTQSKVDLIDSAGSNLMVINKGHIINVNKQDVRLLIINEDTINYSNYKCVNNIDNNTFDSVKAYIESKLNNCSFNKARLPRNRRVYLSLEPLHTNYCNSIPDSIAFDLIKYLKDRDTLIICKNNEIKNNIENENAFGIFLSGFEINNNGNSQSLSYNAFGQSYSIPSKCIETRIKIAIIDFRNNCLISNFETSSSSEEYFGSKNYDFALERSIKNCIEKIILKLYF